MMIAAPSMSEPINSLVRNDGAISNKSPVAASNPEEIAITRCPCVIARSFIWNRGSFEMKPGNR